MRFANFFWAVLLLLLAAPAPAMAHATLLTSEPSDGTIVHRWPREMRLTFSEPVSPLVLRLLRKDGTITRLEGPSGSASTLVIPLPSEEAKGTNVFNWRVTSLDGHPVSGSIVFSVEAPVDQAGAATDEATDPFSSWLIWASRFAALSLLAFVVGAALFRAWIHPIEAGLLSGRSLLVFAALSGLATLGNLAVETANAVGTWSELFHAGLWASPAVILWLAAGAATIAALALAILADHRPAAGSARLYSALAMSSAGLAFALSGHAGSAPPQELMRPAVLLHTAAAFIWIGSLAPLLSLMWGAHERAATALGRFSRPILIAVALLAMTGLLLAYVQLGNVEELWNSAYGLVLSAKLGLLLGLLALAACNRFLLTNKIKDGDEKAQRWMRRSIAAELFLAVAILGVVSLWRFTPPPRAMAAVTVMKTGVQFHIHGMQAMANVVVSPRKPGPATATITLMDSRLQPLAVKEVEAVLYDAVNPGEAIRRKARRLTATTWKVDDLVIPAPGSWMLRLDLLVSDFEKVSIKSILEVPPQP